MITLMALSTLKLTMTWYCYLWSHVGSFVQSHWEDRRHILLYVVQVYVDNETTMMWVVWYQGTFPHKILQCSVGFLNRSAVYTFRGSLHVFFSIAHPPIQLSLPLWSSRLSNQINPENVFHVGSSPVPKLITVFLVPCRWERRHYISEGSPGWKKWLFMSYVNWIFWDNVTTIWQTTIQNAFLCEWKLLISNNPSLKYVP